MIIEISIAIIAACCLLFTVVFVISLFYLIKLLKSARTVVDSANGLIQKAQAHLEKAGTVIDDVKSAVASLKAALDVFRNPFASLITFLSSLISLLINNLKEKEKKPSSSRSTKKQ